LFGISGAAPDVFDVTGRCVLTLQLPAGLSGSTLEFRAHGLVPPGVAYESNPLAIPVQ
jgi:hypothetical protein